MISVFHFFPFRAVFFSLLTLLCFLYVQYNPSDSKIYMSGPSLDQPSRVDQMLEEHDRQLQELNRQANKTSLEEPNYVSKH